MQSLNKNQTWKLMPLPKGKNAVGCKWVFKIKELSDGRPNRFKARLVAQGFSQKYGIDYDEVFAPVVKHTSLRVLLSIAGKRNYYVKHFDAKTAFLNGTIKEEIYMKPPPGQILRGEENLVYKLNRSIYGLKQSARAWNETLNIALRRHGFEACPADPCLYTSTSTGPKVYLIVYVDDMIIASESSKRIEEFRKRLNNEFSITDLGDLKCFLGVQVRRDNDGNFYINQSSYIKKILT